ncbi:MAG: ribosome rescue protein RqcH [Nitrososphaerales archaeon]
MELSSLEVKFLVSILNKELKEYYINNVYSLKEGIFLIKFLHPYKDEKRLLITPSSLWLTKYDFEKEEPDSFVSSLREHLNRCKFEEAMQPNFERIIYIKFSSRDQLYYLIVELFSKGNLILTKEDGEILTLLHKIKVRHRELSIKKKYILPPQKGINPLTLDREQFYGLLAKEEKEVLDVLVKDLSLSKKFLKEILVRAEVEPSKLTKDLKEEEKFRIFEKLREILSFDFGKAYMILKDGEAFDVLPFEFKSYQSFEKVERENFNDALDEFMKNQLEKLFREKGKEEYKSKISELEVSIERNFKLAQTLRVKSENLRKFAENLYLNPSKKVEEALEELNKMVNVKLEENKILLGLEREEVELSRSSSILALASSLFELAKVLERRALRIDEVIEELNEKKKKIIKEMEKIQIKKEIKRLRERFWFERFRWFYTSDGLLAIGGRDPHSNSSLIRKYLEPQDIVFHAELHGSPFFILKGGGKDLYERSLYEVAQATVSFSRAWKNGFSVGDAYWVRPEQVKKAAPSGLYLPKGSFLIEGKKNYIRGIKLQIALGLIPFKEELLVSAGTLEAIKKRALAYVVILPTGEELSRTAKKIIKEFENLVGKDSMKKVSLDDIIRALPPSGGKIIAKGLGEKNN